MPTQGQSPSFIAEGITFTHWDFNYADGWLSDAWLAEEEIEAANFKKAFESFVDRLVKVVSRISLVSQSYIEYTGESFLIHKVGSDVAFVKYTRNIDSVGLMFMEQDQKALSILLKNESIPDEFYYYWNDAVNVFGYSAKLLLMFSALEALVKKDGKKNWELLEDVLGSELKIELFGTKNEPDSGLRHRLVHGEYFAQRDGGKNFLELVHSRIIAYFNRQIFGEVLIAEDVVHPQRHFFGNKEMGSFFLRKVDESLIFSLKEIIAEFNLRDINESKIYNHVHDPTLFDTY